MKMMAMKYTNMNYNQLTIKPHNRGVFCLWDDGYIWGKLKGDKKWLINLDYGMDL